DRRIVEIAQRRLKKNLDRIRQVLGAFDGVEARYAPGSERRLESRIGLKRVSGHVVLSFDPGPTESREAQWLPRQALGKSGESADRDRDPRDAAVAGVGVRHQHRLGGGAQGGDEALDDPPVERADDV